GPYLTDTVAAAPIPSSILRSPAATLSLASRSPGLLRRDRVSARPADFLADRPLWRSRREVALLPPASTSITPVTGTPYGRTWEATGPNAHSFSRSATSSVTTRGRPSSNGSSS